MQQNFFNRKSLKCESNFKFGLSSHFYATSREDNVNQIWFANWLIMQIVFSIVSLHCRNFYLLASHWSISHGPKLPSCCAATSTFCFSHSLLFPWIDLCLFLYRNLFSPVSQHPSLVITFSLPFSHLISQSVICESIRLTCDSVSHFDIWHYS